MGLEMKTDCQACRKILTDDAYICVHECTFCEDCTAKNDSICPNCSGELVRRPKPPMGMEH
ncbi:MULTISPECIES: DUF1272 domain-containing protein [Rossellomorea]|jgi:uncharacterized protein|uniref:DUF1272 domain-containing protein n=1 Tax=Rossellomorea aquimaris TaxID=189382 RepID=A0A5D4UVX0_9BACI|nr:MULTISPECIES: DUF1272 domain-containing protein [Rossellomorea]MDT9027400.1 DUF1272 domain-containing protein [Rossellomorea sp. YC4-1]TYS78902.1 DUF1272 domain-containing protein [Rossellomorea aquimaris]TYS84649.1 DUF1272 domain-containing protein [Rossellomorea aquimaris]TYS91434.1 DUF1272 domain-containing protein [Rossellomorea aquimaris]